MKTISIQQPFASLICKDIKDIENRTWATKFRGRVLVHATAKPSNKEWLLNYLTYELKLPDETIDLIQRTNYDFGAIIGSVEIVGCVTNHKSIWAEKSKLIIDENKVCHTNRIYNWVLANPVLFAEPILNVKGKLSFWDYPMTEEQYMNLAKVGNSLSK